MLRALADDSVVVAVSCEVRMVSLAKQVGYDGLNHFEIRASGEVCCLDAGFTVGKGKGVGFAGDSRGIRAETLFLGNEIENGK